MNDVVLMNQERWADICGYEGIYLISDHGRIMSLYQFKSNGKGGYYMRTKILKPSMSTTGYHKIDLKKDGMRTSFKIHRLVAKYFVANPNGNKIVNHIDGDPLNNHYKNLEWCEQVDNVNHAIETNAKIVFDIDKRSLEYLYLDQNKTPAAIGEIFGISRTPIDEKIAEYGIKKKNTTTYQIEESWLIEQFEKGKKNIEIAKLLPCDPSLISIYRKRIKEGGNIYAQ